MIEQAAAKALFLKENLKDGEAYAGIILDPKGDYHLIVVPGEAEGVTWTKAKAWAKSIGAELPNRCEGALLFATLKGEFKFEWHWTNEEHASDSDYAWMQTFGVGSQGNCLKSDEYRARAVRRVKIS